MPRLHILTRDVGGGVNKEPVCTAATEQGRTLLTTDGRLALRWRDTVALIPAVDPADRGMPQDWL